MTGFCNLFVGPSDKPVFSRRMVSIFNRDWFVKENTIKIAGRIERILEYNSVFAISVHVTF